MLKPRHPSQTLTSHHAERRTREFLKQWLKLIESLRPDPEPFRALLQEEEMQLVLGGTGLSLRSFGEFRQWLRQQAKRLCQSRHRVRNLKIRLMTDGRIRAKIDFDWDGKSAVGLQMGGKLRHEWELHETGERFLRLQRARVTMLEPVEVYP